MHEGHLSQFVNPSVLLTTLTFLAWLFYIQGAYYLGCAIRSLDAMVRQFRVLGRASRNVDDDPENDVGHMLCMLLMGHHLSPQFNIPQLVPNMFSLSWILFSVRGVTWGMRIRGNKPWWDATHAGMFFGMYLMNNPHMPGQPVLIPAQLVFWLWFTGHYSKETLAARERLERVSCFAHFDMGLTMLVMTILLAANLVLSMTGMGSRYRPCGCTCCCRRRS